jgi:hypothetical protein
MKGGLSAFWNISSGKFSDAHQLAAYARGFRPITLLGTYADYPGGQKENVARAISKPANPWGRPPFFERTIRRNIALRPASGPYVQDIEIDIPTLAQAWASEPIRRASGATDAKAFAPAYYRAWADWFTLPLQWTKQAYPDTPVGIYGLQPFQRDYWTFAGRSAAQVADAHAADAALWRLIDPYVDFYVASIYAFYDRPDTVMYFAANVEENFKRTRRYGNKPVYAYTWLRFHDSNRQLKGRELTPYLVEAMAITPYFSGAKGVVAWGWEPKTPSRAALPYQTLPLFARSLARVAALSERVGRGRLVIDTPAQTLWNTRKPLVRRIEDADGGCVVMAINPWQDERDQSKATTTCGGRRYTIPMRGRYTTLMLVGLGKASEY